MLCYPFLRKNKNYKTHEKESKICFKERRKDTIGVYLKTGPITEMHCSNKYRSDTVNSKSFVGKVLLRIKWKFELTVHFKHEMIEKIFTESS